MEGRVLGLQRHQPGLQGGEVTAAINLLTKSP